MTHPNEINVGVVHYRGAKIYTFQYEGAPNGWCYNFNPDKESICGYVSRTEANTAAMHAIDRIGHVPLGGFENPSDESIPALLIGGVTVAAIIVGFFLFRQANLAPLPTPSNILVPGAINVTALNGIVTLNLPAGARWQSFTPAGSSPAPNVSPGQTGPIQFAAPMGSFFNTTWTDANGNGQSTFIDVASAVTA